MPKEVHDESAALIQFKMEFFMRYCKEKSCPDFSTTTFDKVVEEALYGPIPTRKPLGIQNIHFFSIYPRSAFLTFFSYFTPYVR